MNHYEFMEPDGMSSIEAQPDGKGDVLISAVSFGWAQDDHVYITLPKEEARALANWLLMEDSRLNFASDYIIAKQGINKLYELIEQKKYREAADLLYEVEQATYRVKHYVASKLAVPE